MMEPHKRVRLLDDFIQFGMDVVGAEAVEGNEVIGRVE